MHLLKSKNPVLVMIKLYSIVVLMLFACVFLFGSGFGTVAADKTTNAVSSTLKPSSTSGGTTPATTPGKKVPVDNDTLRKIIDKCNKEANDVLGDRDTNTTALTCCVDLFISDCVTKNCSGCSEIQKKKAVDVKGNCEMKEITLTLAQCKALPVKVNLPLIIGCSVAGVVIIILIIAIVVVCYKKFYSSGKPAKGEEVKFKLGKHINLGSEVSEVEVIDNASTAPASSVAGGVSGVSAVGSKAPSVAGSKSKLKGEKGKNAGGGSKDKHKKHASSAKGGKATSAHGASKEKMGGKGKPNKGK